MKKAFAAVIFLLTVCVAATAVLSVSFVGDGTRASAETTCGFYTVDTYSYTPESENDGAFVFPSQNDGGIWSVSGMYGEAYTRESYGTTFYCVSYDDFSSDGKLSGGVTFSFDLRDSEVDISDYSYLRFALGILGRYDVRKGYFVKVQTETSDGEKIAHTTVTDVQSASGLCVVTTDISGLTGTLRRVRVTVNLPKDDLPDQIKLSSPYMSTDGGYFAPSERYLANGFSADAGEFSAEDGVLTEDESGTVRLSGYYAGEYLISNGKTYFGVKLDGADGGSMAVTLRYADSDGDIIREMTSERVSLYQGSLEYVFPFDLRGSITGYTVELSGVRHSSPLVLDKVSVATERESETVDGIGDVSKIRLDGNTVRFEGMIERATAKKYPDAEIGFFAVPFGKQYREAVSLGSIRITTKFENTIDLSLSPVSADTYMFMAALVTSDGEVIPIAAPRYADCGSVTESVSSNLGLHGTAVVGAFESNASHIVADLDLGELIRTDPAEAVPLSYAVYGTETGEKSYASRVAYLDRKTLATLDENINFCISAGIKVYIRFVSSTAIDGLTYAETDARNYCIRAKDGETVQFVAALVRYLSSRYSGLDGFVVCADASRSDMTGKNVCDDTVGYAKELALLMRVVYNAARSNIAEPVTALPLSSDGDVTAERLTVCLSDAIDMIGYIPWTFMSVSDGTDGVSGKTENIGRGLGELGFRPFYEYMIFCDLAESGTGGLSAEEYAGKICAYCEEHGGAKAVIFSLGDSSLVGGREFFSSLKAGNDVGYVDELKATEKIDGSFDGDYVLWDFRDKYYPLGWRAIGVDSCMSTQSTLGDYSTDRVLRADFSDGDGRSAGIVLSNLERTVDMTPADSMTFTFAVGSDSCESASVVFVVGCDEMRAEYSAEVAADGITRTYVCDLGEYEYRDTVDYVGIMVYADRGVVLEIERAALSRDDGDTDAIAAAFSHELHEEAQTRDTASAAMTTFGILLLTVVILVLIVLKEKDTREKTASEKRSVHI